MKLKEGCNVTIKEVAQLTGLTHQAIYKKIKSKGLSIEQLKDKNTGHLTPEGEAQLRELFGIDIETSAACPAPQPELRNREEELTTKVAELTTEVEKLRNQVETMKAQLSMMTEERDFLRLTLERSQHLEAAAIAKLPSPPPALPAGDEKKKRGLRGWLQRMRGGQNGN